MPDEVFCVIIAHELAHLLLRLKNPKKQTPQGFGKSYGDLEKYVDGRIAEWGFDVEGCEKWCAENQMLLIDVYFMANLAPEST